MLCLGVSKSFETKIAVDDIYKYPEPAEDNVAVHRSSILLDGKLQPPV